MEKNNEFDEINQTDILWNLYHMWTAGSRFILNTYWHCIVMVLWRITVTVLREEGYTQGGPFDMILYDQGVTQIIRILQHYMHDVESFLTTKHSPPIFSISRHD